MDALLRRVKDRWRGAPWRERSFYLDPEHSTNQVKTLIVAQLAVAVLGFAALRTFGPGYAAAALAMVATTTLLVLADAVHPPALSTALAFAFKIAAK